MQVYSRAARTRRLVRAASVLALAAAAALAGTALLPYDRHPALHAQFTHIAVGCFSAATALLGAGTALDPRFRRRVPVGWSLLTLVVIAWTTAMLSIHPASDVESVIPVTLQKLVAIALIATLVFQSYEAERLQKAS